MKAGWLVPLALAGCARRDEPPVTPSAAAPAAIPAWRSVATPADRTRLREWRSAWIAGLAAARAGGAGAALTAQGDLFAFDRALSSPLPAAGAYRCRVFKLGSRGGSGPTYTAYPWFACTVGEQGGRATFAKLTGSQRPVGELWPDEGSRGVFLGTMLLGGETRPPAYGRDPGRDVAGWVERVGEGRWRIALPSPAYESLIDVIELVPAG